MDAEPTEQNEGESTRSYTNIQESGKLAFCPHKDLNLPSSYEEVVTRFQKLQGERAMEALN